MKEPLIKFYEDGHLYLNRNIPIQSVSSWVSAYSSDFESEYWLEYKALQRLFPDIFNAVKEQYYKGRSKPNKNFFDKIKKRLGKNQIFLYKKEFYNIKNEWRLNNVQATSRGSQFHLIEEYKGLNSGFKMNPFTKESVRVIDLRRKDVEYQNHTLSHNPYVELEDGCYLEYLAHDLSIRTCGQVDELFIKTIGKVRYFWVNDHKGLALDTPIATTSGWKIMADIAVGDEIFDGSGKPTKVACVSEIHNNPCYKLTFDNGEEITADHEHKWVITQRNYKKEYLEREMTTEEIGDYYKNVYKNTEAKGKLMINNCGSLVLPKLSLPIDPYVLGMWLGDGNRTCGTITCVNSDIWSEIKKRGYETSSNHNRNFKRAESRTLYGLSTELRKLNLLGNKHIPLQYLRASKEQRLDLLRGYMDADGSFNKLRKRCLMQTTNKRQADDIFTLVASLGWKPVTFPYKAKGFGKSDIQAYSVNFSPDLNPFLIRNPDYMKVLSEILPRYKKRAKRRYIKKIEKVETVPTKCLAVDSPEHTYLAGKGLIKTHNTNQEKKMKKSAGMGKMKGVMSEYTSNAVNKYGKIQIPMYIKMMIAHGFVHAQSAFTWYRDYNCEDLVRYMVEYNPKEVENLIRNRHKIAA